MKLTAEQVRRYQQDGCVIVPDFFTAREAAAMRGELHRFVREGLIRNVATDGDGQTISRTQANLQIIPLSNRSELFRAFIFAPHVVEAVSQLIGDDWCRWLDQIFLKPARHGAGTSWHQDNAYFKVTDPTAGVGMWTALHDASRANGTMEVIPRSHHAMLAHERDPGSNHHIRCVVDESQAVPVEVPAGGVVFFNYGIAHCTRGNQTDRDRAGLAYHFLKTSYIEPNVTRAGNAIPVAGPNASGGVQEFGVDLRGVWNDEVQRVLDREAALETTPAS